MSHVVWILFDLALAALTVGMAWAAVQTRDLRRGVLLFIGLGLLLAIVWARLRAPDLALAEAAIGAGIAGALLMAALRDEKRSDVEPMVANTGSRKLINLGSLVLLFVLSWGLLDAVLMSDGVRLAEQAASRVIDSGVSNPVTAVLLNFRAYDTLLELAVVFAAVLGVLTLGPARAAFVGDSPVLMSLVRWLIPLLIVTAGYLLWVGAHAPGGAFQAGAMLAAVTVLLRLGGFEHGGLPGASAMRWLLILGIGVFVIVGLLVMTTEQVFLQYPEGLAGVLILLIEVAATLSIAAALALAYIGGRPSGWEADIGGDTPGAKADVGGHGGTG
jgi:multisubunit Na+/H+ antiporter MnhB subunit